MTEQEHLPNAPIEEALIDLRVKMAEGFEIEMLEPLRELVKEDYPLAGEHFKVAAGLTLTQTGEPVGQSPPRRERTGLIFRSTDKRDVAQFKLDGFTFNRLRPYTNWEEVIKEARRLWELYTNIARVESIVRIAARYINRFVVPHTGDADTRFLTHPPEVPTDGLLFEAFLSRVTVIDSERKAFAHVTQQLEQIDNRSRLAFVIDIDAFIPRQYMVDDTAVWADFEVLRDLKNDLFFDSITQEAKERFL